MKLFIFLLPLIGIAGLGYTFWKTAWINKLSDGTEKMRNISIRIAQGAMAFLKAEYKILIFFVVIVAALLAFKGYFEKESSAFVAFSFVAGALCSGLAGFLGMRVATKANVRTTHAAESSLGKALEVAFTGGSVMGLGVVGLGVIGLSTLFLFYHYGIGAEWTISKVINTITGFSLGASSIALFTRVGGGIFTKAADIGADMVGKVEAGIPEDHPLNPATIADNVGDNVGDVAGMGADLFESYVGSILGTMVLGIVFVGNPAFQNGFNGLNGVLLPLFLSAAGIICSIIGAMFVRVKEGWGPHKALNIGEFIAAALMLAASFFIIKWVMPESWTIDGKTYSQYGVFWATIVGLMAGLLIGKITEHYTGTHTKPVSLIVRQSIAGSATNIISGIGVGMKSTCFPTLVIAGGIVFSYYLAGLYGIALAAVGMLANTGIQLAVDAYGPISDNAGGIAEMSERPKHVRERTSKLDGVGNTTAAIGKGFAIGSAALTSLVLFVAFAQQAHLKTINLTNTVVIAGLFIGGMMPFLFSSLAIAAVGKAAMSMINEVRRQFVSIPELKAALEVMKKHESNLDNVSPEEKAILEKADGKAEYEKCVSISTTSSLKEMVLPGLLAILVPVVIGFTPGLGAEALAGMLVGLTVTGVMLAIFQSNTGGAWDNAKKMIEEGVEVDGVVYKSGSEVHKSTVVGDTVGDPLKDTSGPSLNILMKLTLIVALIIAPSL